MSDFDFGPVVVLLVAVAVLIWFKTRPKKTGKVKRHGRSGDGRMSSSEFMAHWKRIGEMMAQPGMEQTKSAIMEADKLFDIALRQHGFKGETMGERLKDARQFFQNNAIYQGVWEAHKLRNALAHEVGFDVPKAVGITHLAQFKAGLKYLKVY